MEKAYQNAQLNSNSCLKGLSKVHNVFKKLEFLDKSIKRLLLYGRKHGQGRLK